MALALLAVVIGWWQFGGQSGDSQMDAETDSSPSVLETSDATRPTDGADGQRPGTIFEQHTVQSGETLLGIVAQYGATVKEVQEANKLRGSLIRAGDVLLIPIPVSISENGSNDDAAPISTIFNYTVRPGDTVISIAIRFGTNVAAIQEANGIGPDDFIRPEQILQVPVSGVPATILVTGAAAPAQQGSDSGQMYPSIQLLGPDDGARISRAEDVQFHWLSGGLLEQNEWYVLYIWPLEGLFELPPPVWTKATSYRLTSQWAPPPDRDVTYRWQTSVVRVMTNEEGERSIESANAPSDMRSFIWSGGGR